MTFEEVYKILYKKYKVARWDDVDKELKVRDVTTISTWELFDTAFNFFKNQVYI